MRAQQEQFNGETCLIVLAKILPTVHDKTFRFCVDFM